LGDISKILHISPVKDYIVPKNKSEKNLPAVQKNETVQTAETAGTVLFPC
jgi:hypothetical protein